MYYHAILTSISVQFVIGEYEFDSITTTNLNSRFPEYSMTNDPGKVWPGVIVHYVMDPTIGKFDDIYCMLSSYSIHACLEEAYHTCDTQILVPMFSISDEQSERL